MSMLASNSSSTTSTTGVLARTSASAASTASCGRTSLETGETNKKIARNTMGAGLRTVSTVGTSRVSAYATQRRCPLATPPAAMPPLSPRSHRRRAAGRTPLPGSPRKRREARGGLAASAHESLDEDENRGGRESQTNREHQDVAARVPTGDEELRRIGQHAKQRLRESECPQDGEVQPGERQLAPEPLAPRGRAAGHPSTVWVPDGKLRRGAQARDRVDDITQPRSAADLLRFCRSAEPLEPGRLPALDP